MSSSGVEAPVVEQQSEDIPREAMYRLRVDQYERMIQTGILKEEDAVELLEGWQDYLPGDEVPLVIEGREVGRLAVRDVLP